MLRKKRNLSRSVPRRERTVRHCPNARIIGDDGTHMRRRLIMGILAALATGGIVFAFSAPTHHDNNGDRPKAVENVTPAGGDLDLRQATVSADLAPGYTGYLTFDGAEIPGDDLQFVDALNSITLKPADSHSDYATLQPGPHCAGVVYWPLGQTRAQGLTYTWCFRLH